MLLQGPSVTACAEVAPSARRSQGGFGRRGSHDKIATVMNAPVQIRKADTVERLRRLAALEQKSITELVDEMVRERDERLTAREQGEVQRRIAAARETVSRFQALPVVGPLLTDDDLYDEFGLPK